jgi:hypothetical protein
MLTINSRFTRYSTMHAMFFVPFSKPWDLDSRLGAAGHVSSMTYFFKNIWKIRKEYSRLI